MPSIRIRLSRALAAHVKSELHLSRRHPAEYPRTETRRSLPGLLRISHAPQPCSALPAVPYVAPRRDNHFASVSSLAAPVYHGCDTAARPVIRMHGPQVACLPLADTASGTSGQERPGYRSTVPCTRSLRMRFTVAAGLPTGPESLCVRSRAPLLPEALSVRPEREDTIECGKQQYPAAWLCPRH